MSNYLPAKLIIRLIKVVNYNFDYQKSLSKELLIACIIIYY